MLITVCLIVVGLLNILFPKQLWFLSRFMFRITKDGVKLESEPANLLVLILSRVMGILFVFLGILNHFTKVLD